MSLNWGFNAYKLQLFLSAHYIFLLPWMSSRDIIYEESSEILWWEPKRDSFHLIN